MEYFFKYVKDMWETFGKYFVLFFKDASTFTAGFEEYGYVYNYYSANFGVGGWILFVLYYILLTAIIVGIVFLIISGIRRLSAKRKSKK